MTTHQIRDLAAPVLNRTYGPRAEAVLSDLTRRYSEKHRYYHTGEGHLLPMLTRIDQDYGGQFQDKMMLLALFHDAIYDPRKNDNEHRSAELFKASAPQTPAIEEIARAIIETAWNPQTLTTQIGAHFFPLDARILLQGDIPLRERLAYEKAIFQENQYLGWQAYTRKRQAFLQNWINTRAHQSAGAWAQLDLLNLQIYQPKIAIYPDRFDPFTRTHLGRLRLAETVFDQVILAVSQQTPDDPVPNQVAERLPYHHIVAYNTDIHAITATLQPSSKVSIPILVTKGFPTKNDPNSPILPLEDGTEKGDETPTTSEIYGTP